MSRYNLDIYNSYFELQERPFSLAPNPDFLFWSPLHSRAFSMLEYGLINGAPITLISGETGTGKTTLLHYLMRHPPANARLAMLVNTRGGKGDLLRWVLVALGQPAPRNAEYVDLFTQFQAMLAIEEAAGRRVVLIFDEAQNLTRDAIEELRMLTNINDEKEDIIQLVMSGQPELADMLNRPGMSQFTQRVSAKFHLSVLDKNDIHDYIAHRMRIAGSPREIFSAAAVDLISEVTDGIPRLINQICEMSLVYAFTQGYETIPRLTVQQVLDDGLFFERGAQKKREEVTPSNAEKVK